jgi:hypothetical protein
MKHELNFCPLCKLRNIWTKDHKASQFQFKTMPIVCNFCAGPHKVTQCNEIILRKRCSRCGRNNHEETDCFAEACPHCSSVWYHDWSRCREDNRVQKEYEYEQRVAQKRDWEGNGNWSSNTRPREDAAYNNAHMVMQHSRANTPRHVPSGQPAVVRTPLPAPSNASDAKMDKLMAMVEKQNKELSSMKAELAQVRKEKMREKEDGEIAAAQELGDDDYDYGKMFE